MPSGPCEWAVGPHTLRFEPPDMFWVKFRGPLTLRNAEQVIGIYKEMSEARPFFFMAEVQGLSRLEPEAGHYLTENIPATWIQANIYIGARLLHRAMAKGFALASILLDLKEKHTLEQIHHVATVEQARALIDRLRARPSGTKD